MTCSRRNRGGSPPDPLRTGRPVPITGMSWDRLPGAAAPDGMGPRSGLSETALSPVERAARDWRQQVLDDLGGLHAVSATRRALLDAATGSMILLASLDAYVFELAGQGGLANRKHRRVFPVVLDRMRVADGLARQLQTLGLDRQERPPVDLSTYLAQRRSSGARAESQARQAGDDHAPGEPNRNADACP